MAASRNTIFRLINASQHSACPCHGCRSSQASHPHGQMQALNQVRKFAAPVNIVEKEYAFEVSRSTYLPCIVALTHWKVAASNLRFGDGVTAEVGMDLKNMKARKVVSIHLLD